MRADFSLLRNQFLTERKKAEKQVASLKEALKTQRSELEKNLLVSSHRPARQLVRRGAFQSLMKHGFHVEKTNDWATQSLTQLLLGVHLCIVCA